ncbi:LUD_dom domain-containing protein [Rubrivivax sp. A210]|uniref:LutC/YkgG family protein n=1 Tax=Rubrivivax sp. A210 TaxID=2772301 RepID=UPI001919D80E|nr:lactate utilization protein C [Rubrivivax sp. A210]CAD5373110.1 LUD_dom domain-containing protein [Rubrivivax sp. A210]
MNLPDTRGARAAILASLRGGDKAPPLPPPDLTPYRAGPFGRGSQGLRVDPATLIPIFEAAARGWRAEVVAATPGTWPAVVRAALDVRGCRRIAIGAASPLQPALDGALQGLDVKRFEQPLEAWKTELFDTMDAGVTATEAAIADTGTLVLVPGAHEPRTLSLVPPLHVAVLRASTLYAGLPAAMQALSPQAAMPTNLLLVTGPSKTADIQQVLAYGAHGPKELVIVLVDDLNGGEGA